MASGELSHERRSELLDRLELVMLEEGFAGLTVDDFAARLRCSKSTLYRLAPSKQQLVATVGRHFFSRAAQRIERAVAAAPAPPEKLKAYLLSVGKEMGRGTAAFHEQMASHPSTAALYRRNSRAAAERVRHLIHDGAQSGYFEVEDPDFAGQVIATIITAIHLDSRAVVVNGSAAQAHKKLSELVLFGLMGSWTMGADETADRVPVAARSATKAVAFKH